LILPVLVIEFFLHDRVEDSVVLWSLLHVGTGIIWLAFAVEFILMVSVAEKKLVYCKEHWLDLAILLLPLISFLRSVQFIRATNALRLPQFTKMLRVYRMRGTALRALRGLIVLDLFSRFFKPDAEEVVEQLQAELREAEARVRMIRRKLTKAHQSVVDSGVTKDQGSADNADEFPIALVGENEHSGQTGCQRGGEGAENRDSGVVCGAEDDPSGDRPESRKTLVNQSTSVVPARPK
jgi:voltage-gated potassium channel